MATVNLSNQSLSYGNLLSRAWPIILANAAGPILGLVDTAVIGNLGATQDLGAIALGALVFSFVYWSFGFLRMGTTGFIAQAFGAGDEAEVRAILGRALLLATALGLVLILLKWPLSLAAFTLLDASDSVEVTAKSYFALRIWGAPATLAMFALMGVLVGLGRSRQLLIVQLFLNGLNILLDIVFAGVLGWGVEGIALGTVIAEYCAVLVAAYCVFNVLRMNMEPDSLFWDWSKILDKSSLSKTFTANADIMIRTMLLVFAFAWFANQGAKFGDVALAANHLLLQLVAFSAFFLDAYAFVVEALVGQAIGAKNRQLFDLAVRRTTLLALISAVLLAGFIYFFGAMAIAALTDLVEVREAARRLLPLAALYVLAGFAAFQLDGVFIGASFTRQMRNAGVISLAVYLLAWWLLIDAYAVVGLWWAFIIYVIARAAALALFYPALAASVKPAKSI